MNSYTKKITEIRSFFINNPFSTWLSTVIIGINVVMGAIAATVKIRATLFTRISAANLGIRKQIPTFKTSMLHTY